VGGELDIASADAFTSAVAEGLAAGSVLLDLRELSFMDSTGVSALNTALRVASEHGHELRVAAGMQPAIEQILELTGMIGLLSLEERP
jgi:anti-sigma B factor antagonist